MNLNKKLAVAVSGAVMLMGGQFAMADSTSDIVDALVGKGVLTEEEGKLITKGHDSAKSKAAKVVDKNGMLSLSSADGKSTMAIAGRIQLDSRHFSNHDGRHTSNADGFDVRRAYLGVSGTIAKYYDYKVVGNFANTDNPSGNSSTDKSHQLDEAFFGINFWKEASFRFGQQKMPFSLEEQTSSRFIDFQERSMLNKYVPAKEIGAQIHGVFGNGVFYGAAVSTGEGLSKIEGTTTDSNDVIGRVGINFAEAVGNKDDVYHLAIAGSSGRQGNSTMIAGYNSEDKGSSFISQTIIGNRDRLGLEGAIALGSVKIQSEYIQNNYSKVQAISNGKASGSDIDIDGYYVAATWLLTGEKYASAYKAGKFDRISPNKNFNPDDMSAGLGAWEIGARYSSVDASDIGYTNNTSYNKADAYTLGLKWIPSPFVRILLNYVNTEGEKANGGGDLNQKALTLRTQLDF